MKYEEGGGGGVDVSQPISRIHDLPDYPETLGVNLISNK